MLSSRIWLDLRHQGGWIKTMVDNQRQLPVTQYCAVFILDCAIHTFFCFWCRKWHAGGPYWRKTTCGVPQDPEFWRADIVYATPEKRLILTFFRKNKEASLLIISHLLSLVERVSHEAPRPMCMKVSVEKYNKTPIFSERQHFYSYSQTLSENPVQEPWPHDLYFMVYWIQTLARLSRLRFLSKEESQDLLMVASWYFMWGCISMSPAGIYKSHELLTYIYRLLTLDLARLRLRFLSKVESRDLLMVGSWYFIWGTYETSRNIQEPSPPDLYFTVCWL